MEGLRYIIIVGDVKLLREDMEIAKPTLLCAVPRVFVKLYDKM